MRVQLSVYGICKRWRAAKVESNVEYFVTGYEIVKYSDEEALKLGFAEPDDDGEYLGSLFYGFPQNANSLYH